MSEQSEPVIVVRSKSFRGTEIEARDILLAECVKMHPQNPAESDLALARLQRAVRRWIPDARLSMTTMADLTRTPLDRGETCFLIRPRICAASFA